jgi:hypothetical protein
MCIDCLEHDTSVPRLDGSNSEALMCRPEGGAGFGRDIKGEALCARAAGASATLDCAHARAGYGHTHKAHATRMRMSQGVDSGRGCSYFVLMESEEKKGDRWLRLGDLGPHEVIVVRCPCGRSIEYHKGYLQRRHRVPSDVLVYDLQFRLRCSYCNARAGFRITIFDTARVAIIGSRG